MIHKPSTTDLDLVVQVCGWGEKTLGITEWKGFIAPNFSKPPTNLTTSQCLKPLTDPIQNKVWMLPRLFLLFFQLTRFPPKLFAVPGLEDDEEEALDQLRMLEEEMHDMCSVPWLRKIKTSC